MDAQTIELLEMIEMLCAGLEWNIENHPVVMNEADNEALTEARALVARVRANQNPQEAQHSIGCTCIKCEVRAAWDL